MDTKRIILQKKPAELSGTEVFFQRLSGIDVHAVPEKYGESVEIARRLIDAQTEIRAVVQCVDVCAVSEREVALAGGVTLCGDMPPKVLKDAKQAVCFVITLAGFEGLHSDDVMAEYFFDTWGSAVVESAQAQLAERVRQELAGEGLERTHLWCPGQHQFELKNQTALFQLLKPEEIGCTLTKRLMMVPVKSVSGVMGVISAGAENLLRPCDFCRFKSSCPASAKGCAVL